MKCPWATHGVYEVGGEYGTSRNLLCHYSLLGQVHDMPRNRMKEVNARFIGLKLGKLLELDANEYLDVSKRSFLRLRVELDLSKPLVASFPIPRYGMATAWVHSGMKNLLIFVTFVPVLVTPKVQVGRQSSMAVNLSLIISCVQNLST